MIAQWREVVKNKIFALYVHSTHRVAIVQMTENQVWVVTMPDDPSAKHTTKSQEEAFLAAREMARAWFKAALEQLAVEITAEPKKLTDSENLAEIRGRQRRKGKLPYSV